MPKLKEHYRKEVVKTLMTEFKYSNVMQVPRITKVVLNIGVGEAIDSASALDGAVDDLTKIAGQKPVITKAKKSIATFKLREGKAIGVKVTLRGVVGTYYQKQMAQEVLRHVDGVFQITNELEVNWLAGPHTP